MRADTHPGVSFISNSLRNDPNNTTRPKAFINYILFDEQFKYAGGNFSPVSDNPNTVKSHYSDFVLQGILVTKNGYLYVYVSNESPVNVFFDNLQVVHSRGAILEETHYYPFGLAMAGISSKALAFGSPENKKKYNGIEFDNDLDLNAYEANYRDLDPQTGRWWQIDPEIEHMDQWSPYASNYDNPIRFNDPLGNAPDSGGNPKSSTAGKILKGGLKLGGAIAVGGGGGIDVPADVVAAVVVAGAAIIAVGAWIYDQAHSDNTDDLPKGTPVPDDQIIIRPEDKIDRDLLDPPANNRSAPTFKEDGKSVEIHHDAQNRNGPYEEMHPEKHRGKGNDKINHPNKKGPSQIDRKEFRKKVIEYWRKEYPNPGQGNQST